MQSFQAALRFFVRRRLLKHIVVPVQNFQMLQSPLIANIQQASYRFDRTNWRRPLHTTNILQEIVKVPPFADSISEGDVKFSVKVGDSVAQDDTVMEIETDKTSVPVMAPKAGTISEIYVSDGDTVKPGQDLFKID